MTKELVLKIRISARTRRRLDRLSTVTTRSKSDLVADAIDSYLDDEEWRSAKIDEGIADLDAGRTVSHERVAEWLRSWGKPNEKKPPKCY